MFDIVFELTTPLTDCGLGRDFIHAIAGEIRHDGSNATIGHVNAFVIQVGRVADAGEDLGEIMDGEAVN